MHVCIPTATTSCQKCLWCILLTCTPFDCKLPSVSPDLPYHLELQLATPDEGAFGGTLWPNPSTHFDFDLPSAPPFCTSRLVGLGSIRCHHFTYLDLQPHVQPREKLIIAPSQGLASPLKMLSHLLLPVSSASPLLSGCCLLPSLRPCEKSVITRLRLPYEGPISPAISPVSSRLTSFAS